MKKLLLIIALASPSVLFASAPPTLEQPVTSIGRATTVSVSNSAWTLCPAASSLDGRTGVLVNNPCTNSATMVAVLSTSTAIPAEATTVRPLEFAPCTDFTVVPASNKIYLWIMTLATGAENVHIQEVKQ